MKKNVSNEEFFIIQRMVEGDEKAFKYFFDTYYDDLCNFVNGYLRDETLSEDIPRSRAIVSRGLKKVIPYFYASSVIAY
jgi:hypothetical protein